MSVWVWSAGAGVAVGATVFFLALVPLLVWQYRRYGGFNVGRFLGTAAISVYAAALVTYTQLPLPPTRSLDWCAEHGVHELQLRPFVSFETMLMRASEIGWGPMLTSTLGLQVLFNVLLFVPLGLIMRGFFKRGVLVTVGIGALVSLMIEVTQATGLWGMYPCAYRLGDVDDLLTNTFGALLGALLAPLLLFWLPSAATLAASRDVPRPLSSGRRWFSLFINYSVIGLTSTVLSWCIGVVWRLVDGKVPPAAFEWAQFWVHAAVVVLVLIVPAWRGKGSLGMALVWVAPRWRDARGRLSQGRWWQRVARSLILALPLIAASLPGREAGVVVFTLLALITVISVPFTVTHRGISGWITQTELIDTRVSGRG